MRKAILAIIAALALSACVGQSLDPTGDMYTVTRYESLRLQRQSVEYQRQMLELQRRRAQ
jgi:hypothetical protein